MIKPIIILIKLVNEFALFFFLNISFNPFFMHVGCSILIGWTEASPDDVTCTKKHAKVTIRLTEN